MGFQESSKYTCKFMSSRSVTKFMQLQNHEQHGKGGQGMDITKWTRAERKKYSFDKKDPLADVPDKALRDGEVLIGTIC